jgi:hypothetical protein
MHNSAGAHFYRAAVEKLLRLHGPLVMAEMRIEEDGEYAGAVRIFVDGERIASIPLADTDAYRAVVRRLNEHGRPATCHALLEVGEYVNVWLSAVPHEPDAGEPFLPELGGGLRVVLNQDGLEYLEHLLGARAKNKRLRLVCELDRDGGTWAVILNELPIGELPRGSYPRLDDARDGDFPMTARLLVVRQDGRPLRAQAIVPA